MKKATSRGFTLIELMVAIAIIGILSAGAMAAFNNARASARDAKRYSALAQVQLALETYRQVNGAYPSTGGAQAWHGATPYYNGGPYGVTGANGYIPNLAPTYMTVLPLDPVSSVGYMINDTNSGYLYGSNGTDYKFLVYRTMELNKECDTSTDIYWDPVRGPLGDNNTCAVYSAGAAGW